MSSFLKRLRYYGVGFGIGLVFVFFFFQNRGCSWLPSNRVKNAILDRVLTISEGEEQKLKKKDIGEIEIVQLLNTGTVDFDKSKKDGSMKVYRIYNDDLELFFTLPNESFVSEVRYGNLDAKKIKSSTEGMGELIHFPLDNDLVYVDSSALLSCQLEESGYINQRLILKSLKKSGKIDYAQSNFKKSPKPIIYLSFEDKKGRMIGSKSIWYKNKINIQQLDLMRATACDSLSYLP